MRTICTPLVVFILCTSLCVAAQDRPVFDKLNTALRRHCAVCTYHLPADYDSVLLRLMHATGVETFHKSHTALQKGHHETAYRYAQRTIAALNDSMQHPLYVGALFLWAKTNQAKGLTTSAVRQYNQFLNSVATDSVLRGDAYASLADLYFQEGNWEKGAYFLAAWQRHYIPFSDTKTRAALFDRIANGFNSAPVPQPQRAIRIGTELFTKQNDTARLSRFYYNVAQWYARQSDDELAIVYLKRGLALALRSNDYEAQKNSYRSLASLEEKRGQHQTAAYYKKGYEAASDSLYQSGPSPDGFDVQKEKLLQLIKSESVRLPEPTEPFGYSVTEVGWPNVFLLAFICFLLFLIPVRQSRRLRSLHSEVERLQTANSSKNQLLSIIAHDLRSVVHALQINIGKLKTALQKLLITDAIALVENGEHLVTTTQSLLNNLLYWSLSQSGQISYHPEPVAIQPLLNGVCYDLLPLAASKNMALHYTLEQDIVCNCDVNTTKIIFRNLIDNAIKYTPAGGTITVSARRGELYGSVTVQDTGIGMAPDIIEALFTKKSTRIQQDAGGRRSTGMGLWLVKNMAEQNGGALHVSSVAGVGTVMTVTLPMVP